MVAKRQKFLIALAGLIALGLNACATADAQRGAQSAGPVATPIGAGSTSDTGPQPNQPVMPPPLRPGERPPQFVVFSWDGAAEDGNAQFSRFLEVGRQHKVPQTFFLTGLYVLPESNRNQYAPPKNPVGSSAIGWVSDETVHRTIQLVGTAWLEGHEIGTHFNGHYCGSKGGDHWSEQDWTTEINEFKKFATSWRTNTGRTDLPSWPFDINKEVVGGRPPCLQGQKTLLPAAKKAGFRYDASSAGGRQIWPRKKEGLWNFELQSIPVGDGKQTLSMDYNIMYTQSKDNTKGDPAKHDQWRGEATQAFRAGLNRAYYGNRAPLFIGNHFEQWNGGIYMDAVETSMIEMCSKPEVHCVTFRQLADWLDGQDPALLDRLGTVNVGKVGDWPAPPPTASGKASAVAS